MENKITNEQALQNLYVAARRAPLTADEHDMVKQSAFVLSEFLKPKEPVVEEKK